MAGDEGDDGHKRMLKVCEDDDVEPRAGQGARDRQVERHFGVAGGLSAAEDDADGKQVEGKGVLEEGTLCVCVDGDGSEGCNQMGKTDLKEGVITMPMPCSGGN